MKKFSNQDNKEKILKTIEPKNDELIKKLVNENINISYCGDDCEISNKELKVIGVTELIQKVNDYISTIKDNETNVLKESLKYMQYIDESEIDNKIKILEGMYPNMIPTPADIFSSEDYEISSDGIILRTLNNIPLDFMDYINLDESSNYFDDNYIKIRYFDKWEITFETKEDKKKVLKDNKFFIADFIDATRNLVGAANLSISL